MFLNFYNLILLEHLIPGTLAALILAWFIASWSTKHFAVREAHQHADSLQLVDDDRKHFLEWKLTELLSAAEEKVVPMTGVYFTGIMMLFLATGVVSCSGPKEVPMTPENKGNPGQETVQESLAIPNEM